MPTIVIYRGETPRLGALSQQEIATVAPADGALPTGNSVSKLDKSFFGLGRPVSLWSALLEEFAQAQRLSAEAHKRWPHLGQ